MTLTLIMSALSALLSAVPAEAWGAVIGAVVTIGLGIGIKWWRGRKGADPVQDNRHLVDVARVIDGAATLLELVAPHTATHVDDEAAKVLRAAAEKMRTEGASAAAEHVEKSVQVLQTLPPIRGVTGLPAR